jgi:hypothetical protein
MQVNFEPVYQYQNRLKTTLLPPPSTLSVRLLPEEVLEQALAPTPETRLNTPAHPELARTCMTAPDDPSPTLTTARLISSQLGGGGVDTPFQAPVSSTTCQRLRLPVIDSLPTHPTSCTSVPTLPYDSVCVWNP